MARAPRIVAPGLAHHVTQRGNNRQDVFRTDDDRRLYLHTLKARCALHDVIVHAYCLMRNHVHLVVTPTTAAALAHAIGQTHWLYTQHFNRTHGHSGHLWQNRFFSCPLVDEHEIAAIRYTERNPVSAQLVKLPWQYTWSSAAVHCGKARDTFKLLDGAQFARRYGPDQWQSILLEHGDDVDDEHLEHCLRSGRPVADDRGMKRLERLLGRRLPARVWRSGRADRQSASMSG